MESSMESQPQNPEFRINPENFHLCNGLCSLIRPTYENLREMPEKFFNPITYRSYYFFNSTEHEF